MSFSPVLPLHITAGTLGNAVWMCCDLFPQRFPPAWPRWKCVCHIHADPVRKRRVAGVNEIPTRQCSGRHSNLLSGNNGMDHRQARDEKQTFLIGGALLVSLAVGAIAVTYGLEAANSQTGAKHGYPAGPYFFLGSVALLSATGEVRILVRNGISGAQRIARHLWACALRCSSPPRPYSWHGNNHSPLYCARQSYFSPEYPATDTDDFLATTSSVHKRVQAESDRSHERLIQLA